MHLPARAGDRLGVQPVATLTADGTDRAEIPAGARVLLRATAQVPPGAGTIVCLAWDFDGTGTFTDTSEFTPDTAVTIEREYVFTEPGTHFVTVRIASHPDGDPSSPYARVENLARARIIVT